MQRHPAVGYLPSRINERIPALDSFTAIKIINLQLENNPCGVKDDARARADGL